MQARPRLLFLLGHLDKGGMQRAVSNITQALGDNYQMHVAFFGSEEPEFRYNAEMHDLGLAGGRDPSVFAKLSNFVSRLRKLRGFVRSRRIDIVVSFGEKANVLNIASNHRAKKIISIRAPISHSLWDSGRLYARMYRASARFLYPRADAIVTVSQSLRDALQQWRSEERRVGKECRL